MSHQDPLDSAHEEERPNVKTGSGPALLKSFFKTIFTFYLEWPPDYLRIGDHPFSFVRLTYGSHLSATGEEGLVPFSAHLPAKAVGGAS